jgi:hypothetical protein
VLDDDDADVLAEAFAFIRADEHLVLDVTEMKELDARSATLVHHTLIRRAVGGQTVVVSCDANVSMQLVLHDVDRVSPIVRTQQQAMQILDRSCSARPVPH